MRIRIAAVLSVMMLSAAGIRAQIPETYTNLQVLPRQIPRRDLVPIMRNFALNLGIRCQHCHVGEGDDLSKFDFASDAKPAKAVARKMLRMVTTINDQLLTGVGEPAPAGTQKVTCFTCHRGAIKPLTILENPLMDVTIKHNPAFALAVAQLAANEKIKVEPGAMVSHSDGVAIETKAEGGIFGGIKRMVAGESFFQNSFTAPANGGEITLAPSLPGDMRVVDMSGPELLLKSGAYISSESGVSIDASWGGAKGFFGSGGLILLRVSGRGKLVIGAYGAIEERVLAPGQRYTVDTGHIVSLDASITFQLRKSGGWTSAILGGEGLVCELTGPGRVLMQSRSEQAFLGWLIPKLPGRSN